MKNNENIFIGLKNMFSNLWQKRKVFYWVWPITFVLSCVWILPQPRTYKCTTTIAPESSDESLGGGLSSLASSFGINLGSNGQDAIYPQLYPKLFESTEFLSELCDIQIVTKDGELQTDYFDYLANHQKKNVLLFPMYWTMGKLQQLMHKDVPAPKGANGERFNPFYLDRKTSLLFEQIKMNISCTYSQTTEIVTITVSDQDPLVSALMADSVKAHLQDYITKYRTKKARLDYEYYLSLYSNAKMEYDQAVKQYADFCDKNQNIVSTTVRVRKDELENEVNRKNGVMDVLFTRLEAAQAKVQEATPAFITIKNSTVPYRASKPKRMIFVLTMLILSTIGTAAWILREEILEWF